MPFFFGGGDPSQYIKAKTNSEMTHTYVGYGPLPESNYKISKTAEHNKCSYIWLINYFIDGVGWNYLFSSINLVPYQKITDLKFDLVSSFAYFVALLNS